MALDYDLGAYISDEPKWYVAFVRSNQEKHVETHLCHRDIEYLLPCYTSARQWKDRTVKLKVPLFPGYMFVHLAIRDRLKVLTVPNVVSLVGTKRVPSVVSDKEIEWIRCGVGKGDAMPHPYLKAGDAVVIKAGPMAGMEGTLVRVQNSTRVLICLNSISRAFTVAVESNLVEPTHAKAILRHAC